MIPCTSPLKQSSLKQKRISSPDLSGEIVKSRVIGSFTLSENVYATGLALPQHTHRNAQITFVIEGVFHEYYDSETMTCRAGSICYLPPAAAHRSDFETQTRCLQVQMDSEVLAGLDHHSAVPGRPAKVTGLAATWLANRLYAEFVREDSASAIAVEGLVLEVLAEIARACTRPETVFVPSWLKQATDIVESRFLERLSLSDIASEVGVHYVHLSRQFHKYNRCTIGELIRKRRVQHASHLLAHSRTPLAEIALICGFSDQSHLSFLFKRYMGVSPSKFRHLAGLGSVSRNGSQPISKLA